LQVPYFYFLINTAIFNKHTYFLLKIRPPSKNQIFFCSSPYFKNRTNRTGRIKSSPSL